MLRRLAVLLLLLAPATARAQTALFPAPGGLLYYDLYVNSRGAGPHYFLWYLLDSSGNRTQVLEDNPAPGHPSGGYPSEAHGTGILGNFVAGAQIGFEFDNFDVGIVTQRVTTMSGGDASTDFANGQWVYQFVSDGSATPVSVVKFRVGDISLITPEPVSIALLATGLVGLGAVGWRRRRQGVA